MRAWLQFARRPLPALLVGLAALVACDSPTAPALGVDAVSMSAPSRAGGTVMVPFSLRQSNRPAPDAVLVPCTPLEAGVALPSRIVGTGVATHLGKVTSIRTAATCAVSAEGVLTISGSVVHTAANGDQLFATFTATITPEGIMHISATFTGGTGRFAHATGSVSGRGTFDARSGSGVATVTGVISRPNS